MSEYDKICIVKLLRFQSKTAGVPAGNFCCLIDSAVRRYVFISFHQLVKGQ